MEILVSVSVLTVALLGTAASLHFGMQASMHGSYYTEASANCRQLLEVMLAENRAFATAGLPDSTSGYNDGPGVTRPLNDPPFNLSSYSLTNTTRYQRNISVIAYSQPADSSTVRLWKDGVRQITVTISWPESGHTRTVSLSSLARRPL
jgi:Tfp pilus assembly protein PilV